MKKNNAERFFSIESTCILASLLLLTGTVSPISAFAEDATQTLDGRTSVTLSNVNATQINNAGDDNTNSSSNQNSGNENTNVPSNQNTGNDNSNSSSNANSGGQSETDENVGNPELENIDETSTGGTSSNGNATRIPRNENNDMRVSWDATSSSSAVSKTGETLLVSTGIIAAIAAIVAGAVALARRTKR